MPYEHWKLDAIKKYISKTGKTELEAHIDFVKDPYWQNAYTQNLTPNQAVYRALEKQRERT
jgi:hypothetical protein